MNLRRQAAVLSFFFGTIVLLVSPHLGFPWWIVMFTLGLLLCFGALALSIED